METQKVRNRRSANQRKSKLTRKATEIEAIKRLGLCKPASCYRDPVSCLRCPPPCIRKIETNVKGKWVGKPLREVLKDEFYCFQKDDYNRKIVSNGLLCINGVPIDESSFTRKLKNMDVFSRILHWHEPPVIVPSPALIIRKVVLPIDLLTYQNADGDCRKCNGDIGVVYVCEKPSSVPVHPAGPYLANTLTLMAEAQLGLEPRSLLPCHRLDRVTSGTVLCCSDHVTAKLLQSHITSGSVSKLYLARVNGEFPSGNDHFLFRRKNKNIKFKCEWVSAEFSDIISHEFGYVNVVTNISTRDVSNGLRCVSDCGKESISKFQLLWYDKSADLSVVACIPVTGRSHQLRVHLQFLGFPIHNDLQYGGQPAENTHGQMKEEAINAMKRVSAFVECPINSSEMSKSLIQAVIDTCACCGESNENLIENAFSSSQLLMDGEYAIDLHALKYRIKFKTKHINESSDISVEHTSAVDVDFFTGVLPTWMKGYALKCLA